MTTQTFQTRLLGGHDLAVTYDNIAGTISVLGQSISVSALSIALQNQWAAAVAEANTPDMSQASGKAAFGGDDVGAAVGAILDAQGSWRNAIQAVLTNAGPVAVNEGFNH